MYITLTTIRATGQPTTKSARTCSGMHKYDANELKLVLQAARIVSRDHWITIPMPQEAIDRMNELSAQNKRVINAELTYYWDNGPLTNNIQTDSELHFQETEPAPGSRGVMTDISDIAADDTAEDTVIRPSRQDNRESETLADDQDTFLEDVEPGPNIEDMDDAHHGANHEEISTEEVEETGVQDTSEIEEQESPPNLERIAESPRVERLLRREVQITTHRLQESARGVVEM